MEKAKSNFFFHSFDFVLFSQTNCLLTFSNSFSFFIRIRLSYWKWQCFAFFFWSKMFTSYVTYRFVRKTIYFCQKENLLVFFGSNDPFFFFVCSKKPALTKKLKFCFKKKREREREMLLNGVIKILIEKKVKNELNLKCIKWDT